MSDYQAVVTSEGVHTRDDPAETIRCQWCSTPAPARAERCPACGSSLATNDVRVVADSAPATAVAAASGNLVEWWRDEAPVGDDDQPEPPSFEETERRRMISIGIMVGAVICCSLVGWASGPLLRPLIENFTGSPANDVGALRSTGGVLGFLSGMFFGAIGGWVTWSGK